VSTNKKSRLAVLGGGISGCVVAGEVVKSNKFDVVLIERNPFLGGLHHSMEIDGMVFDIGPFLFGRRHSLFKTFPSVREKMVAVDSLFQSLTENGSIDKYPLSVRGYYYQHGPVHCAMDLLDIFLCKFRYHSRDNLPAFVKYYLGSRLYKKSGLKTYIERMYGIPDSDVAIEFAEKRMQLIAEWASFRRIISGVGFRKKTILNSTPVIPNDLVRPPEGFRFMYDTIQGSLDDAGVDVRLGGEILHITREKNQFKLDLNGCEESFDAIVSSIPMETLARLLKMNEIPELDYVPLYSLFYRFRGELGFAGNLLHNFSTSGMWKRITLFSAMYGEHNGWHYFVAEGTIHSKSSSEIEVLSRDFESHSKKMGILTGTLEFLKGLVTSRAYPGYDSENLDRAKSLKNRITSIGIKLTGRQGEFDYISSADAAASALRLADKLTA